MIHNNTNIIIDITALRIISKEYKSSQILTRVSFRKRENALSVQGVIIDKKTFRESRS